MSTLGENQPDQATGARRGNASAAVEDDAVVPSAFLERDRRTLRLYGWLFVQWRQQRLEASRAGFAALPMPGHDDACGARRQFGTRTARASSPSGDGVVEGTGLLAPGDDTTRVAEARVSATSECRTSEVSSRSIGFIFVVLTGVWVAVIAVTLLLVV